MFKMIKKENKKGLVYGYKDELHEFVGIIAVIAVAVAVFLIFRNQLTEVAGQVINWVKSFFENQTIDPVSTVINRFIA